MSSPSHARSTPLHARPLEVAWRLQAALKHLQRFATTELWWLLSIGIVVAIWESAAALQLIDPLILPPPHAFIAEIKEQA